MSLVASVIVSALPLIGGVHLDADAQGGGVLGWSHLRGPRFVVQVADVRDGRLAGARHRLWRSTGNADLDDLDVAGSGAAVACLTERLRRTPGASWRLRVALRPPGGRWSVARPVARTRHFLDHVTCGVSDAGDATVAWQDGFRVRAAHVSATGAVEPAVSLATHPVDPPVVEVAPDGSAAVVYSKTDRVVRLAQRSSAGAWSTRGFGPERGFLPMLAMVGPGQPLVAWRGPAGDLRMVAGPAFAPAVLTPEQDTAVGTLTANARGDVLATWITHSSGSTGPSAFVGSVARPGAAFSAGVSLGPLGAYPLAGTLAADGSGAVGWYAGTGHRSRPVVRTLSAGGAWGPPRELSRTGVAQALALAGAPGGAVTVAWTERRAGGRRVVLRLARL